MTTYRPSKKLLRALITVLDAARDEAIPETGNMECAPSLSPDLKRALSLLGEVKQERASRRERRRERPPPPAALQDGGGAPDPEIQPAYSRLIPAPESGEGSDDASPSGEKVASPAKEAGVAPQPGGVPAWPDLEEAPQMLKKNLFLKNARIDQPYDEMIETAGLEKLVLQEDGECGLSFDEETARLSGVPRASGDFQLRFRGALHGKPAEIIANLAVIPDPKSLWVSKDSDKTDPFWKPDEDFGMLAGDLLAIAASKRGRSHAKDGGFRDDDFSLRQTSDGWTIAAVADGAGSAKFSRRASKIAVEQVKEALPYLLSTKLAPYLPKLTPAWIHGSPTADIQIKSYLYQSLVTAAFDAARAIEEEALRLDEPASGFLTTLIITVAKRMREGWFVAGFSIGDGGAVLLDAKNGALHPLTLPDSGEFAGQTRFLQKTEFAAGFDGLSKRLFFTIIPGFTALIAMTDGVSDPKFQTDANFADPQSWKIFWEQDLAASVDFSTDNEGLERQILEWLDFWSPGNHDDRTLAVIIPDAGGTR